MKLKTVLPHVFIMTAIAAFCGCFETHYYSSIKTTALPDSYSNSIFNNNIVMLDRELQTARSNEMDAILYAIASNAMRMHVSDEEYRNVTYSSACHLKRNFFASNYIAYDGYHLILLTNDFPNSGLTDNAAFELIYINPFYQYDIRNLSVEQSNLSEFMIKYPRSDLYFKAKIRYDQIDEILKSTNNNRTN